MRPEATRELRDDEPVKQQRTATKVWKVACWLVAFACGAAEVLCAFTDVAAAFATPHTKSWLLRSLLYIPPAMFFVGLAYPERNAGPLFVAGLLPILLIVPILWIALPNSWWGCGFLLLLAFLTVSLASYLGAVVRYFLSHRRNS